MVLDSMRTLLIWGFSLIVKWESFCWVEIIGFAVLLAGMATYNAIVRIPGFSYDDAEPAVEDESLLDSYDDTYEGVEDPRK